MFSGHTMIVQNPFRIANSSGDAISGDLRYEDVSGLRPALLICHGFTAHKDWGPFPYFGEKFARLGFASIVFNFSHNGIGENFRRFSEIEKFSRNTIGKELEDVRGVLDAVTGGEIGNRICDPVRLGIIGHSRGGGIAILAGSYDARVKAVSAWSTVGTFFRFTQHQRETWEQQGYLPVKIKSAPTKLRYGLELLRDLDAKKDFYDLKNAVRRLQIPLLLVHGAEDVSVKPKEAEELYAAADHAKTELVILDHVGHSYGATSPFRGTNRTIEQVTDLTADWFTRHL
jgi:uncharacterized protein